MGSKMSAAYFRAYRARRRTEGRPVTRREGYVRDRSTERKHRGLGRPRRIAYSTLVEIPRFDPHPLVDQAIAHLRPIERSELGSDFDSIVGDLVGEYVLAALEGADPEEAMHGYRMRRLGELARLVFGTSLVDGLDR